MLIFENLIYRYFKTFEILMVSFCDLILLDHFLSE